MSRSLWVVLGLLVALVVMAMFWQWLSMQDVLTVNTLKQWLSESPEWRNSPWIIPAIMAGYVLGLLVMFPLTILVAVTGLVFGPLWGFLFATAGTLASSVVSYWVGRRLGREALMNYGGRHLKGMSRYLAHRGIRTMTVINLLPLAPFTLTNMMAGAFHLRFRDYMLGSTLGIVPGLAAVTLLGSQLGALIAADGHKELLWSLFGLAIGGVLLVILRQYSQRKRH
ncbi:TVP38/TMEM64 family protein [Halomonas sp. LS-001]